MPKPAPSPRALTDAQRAYLMDLRRDVGLDHSDEALSDEMRRHGATKVTRRAVASWFSGTHGIRPENVPYLAAALNVPLESFEVELRRLRRAADARTTYGRVGAANNRVTAHDKLSETAAKGAADVDVSVSGMAPLRPHGEPAAEDDPFNVAGIVARAGRQGVGGLPVYEWGTCGNPTATRVQDQPLEVERRLPDGVDLKVLGPQGFGVRVRGRSMAMWGLEDGDICWVNPREGPRNNRLCLALVTMPDGSEGMVIKLYRERDGRCVLESDGFAPDGSVDTGELNCEQAVIIGPVIYHDPAPRAPRRRDLLTEQTTFLGPVDRRPGYVLARSG